jgi:iron complex transport system substrate-binding protein
VTGPHIYNYNEKDSENNHPQVEIIINTLNYKLKILGLIVLSLCLMACPVTGADRLRIVSLDMCSDQYALALLPASQILSLSKRVGLPESYYHARLGHILRHSPSLEVILRLKPDLVLRTWGGDSKLLQKLETSGINLLNIKDVNSLAQARSELYRVGYAMKAGPRAMAELIAFDQAIKDIRPVGEGRSVIYYTPSGYSAGHATFVGHLLQTLGYKLLAQKSGYHYLSPELILSLKPDVFALGFYEDPFAMRRVPGRQTLVRETLLKTPHISIPSAALACSGWYSAYILRDLARKPL